MLKPSPAYDDDRFIPATGPEAAAARAALARQIAAVLLGVGASRPGIENRAVGSARRSRQSGDNLTL